MKPLPEDFHTKTFEERATYFETPWRGNGADDEAENYEDTLARVVPKEAIAASEPLPKLVPIRFIKGEKIPPRGWTVHDGWIPERKATLFQGNGGDGKSTIGQQLQSSCATGLPWLGLRVEECASIGIYTEDEDLDLKERQAAIDAAYGQNCIETGQMHMFPMADRDAEIVVFDRNGTPTLTPFYRQICEAAQDYRAKLVMLDVAVDLYGGDEIKRRQVRAFMRPLHGLARKIDGSVVLTSHVSVAGIQSDGAHSGSTDWSNAVRSRLYLSRPKDEQGGAAADPNERILTRKKANHASIGDTIKLHWRNGVFMPAASAGSSQFRRSADDVFLALLDAVIAEGQKVSAKPRAGNNAPAFFMKRTPAEREDYQRVDFERSMQALLRTGKIKIVPYGQQCHGYEKLVRGDDRECQS
jgi:hypothetical protein